MKKQLDLRGLTCPEPVLRTKKIIDDQAVLSVEALVDSEVNVQNLERLARSQNLFVKKESLGSHFRITMDRKKDHSQKDQADEVESGKELSDQNMQTAQASLARGGGTVVFLPKDTFGQGSDNLKDYDFSHNLLNVFLQTINQSGHKPSAVLLANSGVRLIDPGASTYKVLCDLKDGGTTVLACGLCLDYYGLKEKVPLEQITNMFAICEYLFAADQILSP